jgi:hypothetical protein
MWTPEKWDLKVSEMRGRVRLRIAAKINCRREFRPSHATLRALEYVAGEERVLSGVLARKIWPEEESRHLR